MKLWIRSQDKTTLIRVNRVDVETNSIIIWEGFTEVYLGSYKTKERALEVLDEIQKMDFANNLNVTLTTYGYVYEMPKE